MEPKWFNEGTILVTVKDKHRWLPDFIRIENAKKGLLVSCLLGHVDYSGPTKNPIFCRKMSPTLLPSLSIRFKSSPGHAAILTLLFLQLAAISWARVVLGWVTSW
jgi:hypothetical protein